MAIVVEVLARNHTVTQRHLFKQDTIKIGRAFDNDVHLDDPYVCAHHVDVSKVHNDGISIKDNHSVNGLKINGQPTHEHQLQPNDVVTLGRSRVRIFCADSQIADTVRLSQLEEKMEWLSYRSTCLVLLLILAASLGFNSFFNTFTDVKSIALLQGVAKSLLLISFWPLIFIVIAKLNRKDSHFLSQFSIIFIAMLGFELLSHIETLLQANAIASDIIVATMIITKMTLFFGLLWFALYIGFHQSAKKRRRITLSVTALVFLGFFVPDLLNINDFNNQPEYDGTLLPSAVVFNDGVSPDVFVQQSESIFVQATQRGLAH